MLKIFNIFCLLLLVPCLVSGFQQRFRERPADTVAIEGQNVRLICIVEHQQGRLQWVKDGFALGYTRSLPGYQRYRVVGNAAAGEHHLEITAVTDGDQGSYQCQVSPSRRQRAIKADATLTVLVRPKSTTLLSNHTDTTNGVEVNDPTSSDVGVNDRRMVVTAGRWVSITCLTTGSRPPANITWRINNKTLHSELAATNISLEESVLASRSSSRGHQLFDTRSQLTMSFEPADDGALLTCHVVHPAITSGLSGRSNLTSSVHLSVLHEPETPHITGVHTEDAVNTGDVLLLTCSVHGGNPLGTLHWYRNKEPVTFSRHSNTTAVWAVIRVNVAQNDHNAIYRCEVSSPLLPEPKSTELKLKVNFGPGEVILNGSQEAAVGASITALCLASNSNPPAEITWLINGQPVSEVTQLVRPGSSGWQTSAHLTALVHPDRRSHTMHVTCVASNKARGINVTQRLPVDVLRPPRHPKIMPKFLSTPLEGATVELDCDSPDGNPPAVISWQVGGASVYGQPIRAGRSRLTSNVTAADNGAVITCFSENRVTDRPLNDSYTLTVLFAAREVVITATPRVVSEGESVRLTCESSSSLPAAEITWHDLTGNSSTLPATSQTLAGQQYRGYVTRSEVMLTPSWRDNGRQVQCRADMPALRSHIVNVTTLNVTHAPVFEQVRTRYRVRLNDSININLTARSNPGQVRYEVQRGDQTLSHGWVSPGQLRLDEVTREMAGWYLVTATNSEGSATIKVHLDVLYGPQNVSIQSAVISGGESATLQCVSSVNPADNTSVTWKFPDGTSVARDQIKTVWLGRNTFASSFRVQSVAEKDEGAYTCVTNNGIEPELIQRPYLLISRAPQLLKSAVISKFAALNPAQLNCTAVKTPTAEFVWYRRGQVIDSTVDKYHQTSRQINMTTWRSTLLIKQVNTDDLGLYSCRAFNRLGSDTHNVTLMEPQEPEAPSSLHVLNISSHTVTIGWRAGFDGGLRQSFRVLYSVSSSETGPASIGSTEVKSGQHQVTLTHLSSNTEYDVHVRARNRLGLSRNSSEHILVRTAETPLPVGYVTNRDGDPASVIIEGASVSDPLVMGVTVSVAALLLINISIISCIVHKRRNRLHRGTQKPLGDAAVPGTSQAARSISVTCRLSSSQMIPDEYKTDFTSNHQFDVANWMCDVLPSPVFEFSANSFRPRPHVHTPDQSASSHKLSGSGTKSLGNLCDLVESTEQLHSDWSWQVSTPQLTSKLHHPPRAQGEYDLPRTGDCLRHYTTLPCRALRVPSSLLRMRPITPPMGFNVNSDSRPGSCERV